MEDREKQENIDGEMADDFNGGGREAGNDFAAGTEGKDCPELHDQQEGNGENTADGSEDPETLKKMLAGEQARAGDYFNRLARLQADFDNFRKRVAREREDLLKYSGEQLVLALLPVVDNFDRALASGGSDPEKLLEGVQMISRQLNDVLAREGLLPITAVGREFDPEQHEAVIREESGDHPENTVVEELRRGYTFKGKVIRASMVKVAG